MKFINALLLGMLGVVLGVCTATAETSSESENGDILTIWPLVDYRKSPQEGYSNLSVLGPLFKWQRRGNETDLAVRPLFFTTTNKVTATTETEILYPVASSKSDQDGKRFQVLKLFQREVDRTGEEAGKGSTMFFPFYINGTSEKYGPYTSVFPIYGDIYERFWKDEYHYVLFPLYSRTVKKGTTNRNFLYPIFSVTEGEKESGFQVWPLYGQSAKEGVYKRRFALWPFFVTDTSGLDTDNPTEKLSLLPLYAASDSPTRTSRHYLWPFFGHSRDEAKKQEEWDILWPFWVVERGEKRVLDRWLPFYSEQKGSETLRRWYQWPLYCRDELDSEQFRQERDRILYFLYSDKLESWPVDGANRRRVAFWPLFLYNRDTNGTSSLSLPALLEPVLDREGIERNWAPLWRFYVHRWNGRGDSALSILWNLYWHEKRGSDLAYELFPLVSWRSVQADKNFAILKGLVRYRSGGDGSSLSLLWLPFGVHWGEKQETTSAGASSTIRSNQ